MADFAKFKRDMNATKVPADLLGEVMVICAAMSSAERDIFEFRATRILDLLAARSKDRESGECRLRGLSFR